MLNKQKTLSLALVFIFLPCLMVSGSAGKSFKTKNTLSKTLTRKEKAELVLKHIKLMQELKQYFEENLMHLPKKLRKYFLNLSKKS